MSEIVDIYTSGKSIKNDNDLQKAGNRKGNKRDSIRKFVQTARTDWRGEKYRVDNDTTSRSCVVVKKWFKDEG